MIYCEYEKKNKSKNTRTSLYKEKWKYVHQDKYKKEHEYGFNTDFSNNSSNSVSNMNSGINYLDIYNLKKYLETEESKKKIKTSNNGCFKKIFLNETFQYSEFLNFYRNKNNFCLLDWYIFVTFWKILSSESFPYKSLKKEKFLKGIINEECLVLYKIIAQYPFLKIKVSRPQPFNEIKKNINAVISNLISFNETDAEKEFNEIQINLESIVNKQFWESDNNIKFTRSIIIKFFELIEEETNNGNDRINIDLFWLTFILNFEEVVHYLLFFKDTSIKHNFFKKIANEAIQADTRDFLKKALFNKDFKKKINNLSQLKFLANPLTPENYIKYQKIETKLFYELIKTSSDKFNNVEQINWKVFLAFNVNPAYKNNFKKVRWVFYVFPNISHLDYPITWKWGNEYFLFNKKLHFFKINIENEQYLNNFNFFFIMLKSNLFKISNCLIFTYKNNKVYRMPDVLNFGQIYDKTFLDKIKNLFVENNKITLILEIKIN